MQKHVLKTVILSLSLLFAQSLFSHCEIPCGIYNDKMRCRMIEEHIKTIEKAMMMINDLSKEGSINYNQLVRWINNKEDHANEIQHIVSQYFMTQRIKPVDDQSIEDYKEYVKKLTLLHEMLIYAMKTKQTTDLENVKKLRSLLTDFEAVYFDTQDHKHEHSSNGK